MSRVLSEQGPGKRGNRTSPPVGKQELGPTWVQNSGQLAPFSSLSSVRATESTRFMERAMGIELHPKFVSLTKPRRYQPLPESIVANEAARRRGAHLGCTRNQHDFAYGLAARQCFERLFYLMERELNGRK